MIGVWQRVQSGIRIKNIAMIVVAFLIGRVKIFSGISPFCIPLFVSGLYRKQQLPFIGIVIALGVLSTRGATDSLLILVVLLLIYLIAYRKDSQISTSNIAKISSLVVLITGMARAFLNEMLLYEVLIVVFDVFMTYIGVMAFRNAIFVLKQKKEVNTFSNEDFISVIIMLVTITSGLSNISILDMSLTNIVNILLILIFGYRHGPGIGATCGVIIGLFSSAVLNVSPLVIGSYTICGLLAGLLGHYGRVGSSLGFVIGNSFLTIYLNGSVEALIILREIVVAIIIFMFVSDKLLSLGMLIAGNVPMRVANREVYIKRVKEIILSKLKKISIAFEGLSDSIAETCSVRESVSREDVALVFDRVVDKLCKDCNLSSNCWGKNFCRSQQVMFKAIESLEEKGHLEIKDLPSYFSEYCVRIDRLVNAFNNSYNIFRNELMWMGKLNESKRIICAQFEHTSSIISNAVSEAEYSVRFMNGVEEAIINRLCRKGINVKDVVVYKDENKRFNILVYHEVGYEDTCRVIKQAIFEVIGKRMEQEHCPYQPDNDTSIVTSRFFEQEKYAVVVSTAKVKKSGNMVSGDNFAFRNLGNGKYMALLGDGTGTGMQAYVQSERAVDFLELLVGAGFSVNIAVNIVNSIFMADSADEMSTTLDIVMVDLYTGWVEFIKRGAVPSFIIDSHGIRKIEAFSLPIGISNTDTNVEKELLSDGGFIVLISDGIYDIAVGRNGDIKSFYELLVQVENPNPKKFADDIMEKVLKMHNAEPSDDMLVVVIKIWQRV